MSENKFSYYQYQKELGYEIYLRFEDFDFESQFVDTLEVMGFNKVEREKIKTQTFNKSHTRVLKIVKASAKVARQIDMTDYVFDKYGPESMSRIGNYDVYRYKNVGMMIFAADTLLWELGVKNCENEKAIRSVLTRYLSFSLASIGVVGFWGVPIEQGFVVMKPKSSNAESVFIDLKKNILITYDGIKTINSDFQILRLDSTLKNEMRRMKPDDLFSFLSMNTAHLSYTGVDFILREAIRELSQVALGYIYPESNFKPRMDVNNP